VKVRGAAKLTLDLLARAADLMRLLPGRLQQLGGRELANKVESFRLFDQARSRADGAGDPDPRDPYRALWVTEGRGYALAERAYRQGAAPRGLLGGADADGSLIPLHTGMGLALAERALRHLSARGVAREASAAVARFVAACRDNSRPGYAEAALEALGLVARNLRPGLVPLLDRVLAGLDPTLPAYFWHGVGRGLYFAPTNLVPCRCPFWPGLERARSEPPYQLGRLNAVAGLSWALALVNVRHPEVIAAFVDHLGDGAAWGAAFADGLCAALMVWDRWAPGSPQVAALLSHRAGPAGGRSQRRWERLVVAPARTLLARGAPDGGVASIFRYGGGGSAAPR
jgi:hypothetical protein